MAFELKISTSYYSKLERMAEEITLSRLLNICKILEISPLELLGDLVAKPDTVQEGQAAYQVKQLTKSDLDQTEQKMLNAVNALTQLINERMPPAKVPGKKPAK